MNYGKKVLMAMVGALTMMALPNVALAMEKECRQEKISAEAQLFKDIDLAFVGDLEKLEKILDDNPRLVNTSMSTPEYNTISPLEYAAENLKALYVQNHVLAVMQLLIAKGATISSLVIDIVSQQINKLSNDIEKYEGAVKNITVKSMVEDVEENIAYYKMLLAKLQEFKSYLEEKIREQKKVEARILNLQTTQPGTWEIDYLKSIKREQ